MTHLAAFALCLTGFAALAVTSARQQRRLFVRPMGASSLATVRMAGWAALAAALALLVSWQAWGLGLVMFSGHTSLAAGVVHAGLIAYAQRTSADAIAD
jgi:hypothetical protein